MTHRNNEMDLILYELYPLTTTILQAGSYPHPLTPSPLSDRLPMIAWC